MNRHVRRLSIGFVLLLVVLLALRLALPGWLRGQVNARLAHMGAYRGQVADVDVHLWRGAYTLKGLKIQKVDGAVPVPLADAPVMDVAVSWDALLHGGVVARVELDAPVLNFVDAPDKSQSQAGGGVDWRKQLENVLPIRLDEVVIKNGTVTFQNFVSSPRVDLRATEVEATVRNLTNVRKAGGTRTATLDAKAKLFEEAPMEAHASFDPIGQPQAFDFQFRVSEVQLTRANALTRAYTGLDLASGHGSLTMELHADHGHVSGYAKPLLQDMQIFSWKQDVEQEKKNPLQLGYEALAGAVTSIFTNRKEDQFATRVPISGDIGDTHAQLVPALIGILRNAFVEAYKPQFEDVLKHAPDKK